MRVPVGKTIELEVDVTKCGLPRELPANASYIVYIGLRNVLMDAHARVPKSDPNCVAKSRALVERKLETLYRGQIRTFSASRATDPIASEIRRLATNIVQKRHAAALAEVSAKDRLAQLRMLVTSYVAEHEKELRPLAERRLRELDELTVPSTADEPPVKAHHKTIEEAEAFGSGLTTKSQSARVCRKAPARQISMRNQCLPSRANSARNHMITAHHCGKVTRQRSGWINGLSLPHKASMTASN